MKEHVVQHAGNISDTTVRRVVVAIDGPSASGKGTIAKALASALGFVHLDTGMLYRIFSAEIMSKYAHSFTSKKAITIDHLDREKMLSLLKVGNSAKYSTESISRAASVVARNQSVRLALLEVQREFIFSSERGIVLDGRDVSTVVCPDADVKIFVTAHASERARRRTKQLWLSGNPNRVQYKNAFYRLLERDTRDSCRKAAPLRCAREAIYLNNSNISMEKSLQLLMKKIKTFL